MMRSRRAPAHSSRSRHLVLRNLAAIGRHVYILAMLYVELAIIVALILINGLLALAELAIVSSRRARLQALVDHGVVGARCALALASDPGRFLSTVQIGITLVGVLSGAFSGSTLGLRLAQEFAELGLPVDAAEAVGVGLVVAVITYFSLVIGELVPKRIGCAIGRNRRPRGARHDGDRKDWVPDGLVPGCFRTRRPAGTRVSSTGRAPRHR